LSIKIKLIVTKYYIAAKNIDLHQINLFFQQELNEIFFTINQKNEIYLTELYIPSSQSNLFITNKYQRKCHK